MSKRRLKKSEEQIYEEEQSEDEQTFDLPLRRNQYQVARTGVWHNFLLAIKDTILKPFFMGAAGAFGISVGYALYDASAIAFRNWAIIKATTTAVHAVTGSSQ